MLLNKLYNDLTVTVERIVNEGPTHYGIGIVETNNWVVRLVCKEPAENTDGEIEPIDLTLNHRFDSEPKAIKTADAVCEKALINRDRWLFTDEAIDWADGDMFDGEKAYYACRSFEA